VPVRQPHLGHRIRHRRERLFHLYHGEARPDSDFEIDEAME